MEILEYGVLLPKTERTCPRCFSRLAYNKYDVKRDYGEWQRTGIESSKRKVTDHIVCPVCNGKIILDAYMEEY